LQNSQDVEKPQAIRQVQPVSFPLRG
jgi:membrane-associated HD superfamily phosphohydrolase